MSLEQQDIYESLRNNPMFTADDDDSDDDFNPPPPKSKIDKRKMNESESFIEVKRSPKGKKPSKKNQDPFMIENKNKLFDDNFFSKDIGIDEFARTATLDLKADDNLDFGAQNQEGEEKKLYAWIPEEQDNRMDQEKVSAPISIQKSDFTPGEIPKQLLEENFELEIDFGLQKPSSNMNSLKAIVNNTEIVSNFLNQKTLISKGELMKAEIRSKLDANPVIKSREDMKRLRSNKFRYMRELTLDDLKDKFKTTEFIDSKKIGQALEDDSDSDFEIEGDAPNDNQEQQDAEIFDNPIEEDEATPIEEVVTHNEQSSNENNNAQIKLQAPKVKLTMEEILRLECDEEDLNCVEIASSSRSNHSSMSKHESSKSSHSSPSPTHKRLMKKREFREIKYKERKLKKQEYLKAQAKKFRSLASKMSNMDILDNEAELGEIDKFGNEIKLEIEKENEEDDDEQDIEGLIDDLQNFEGDEDALRKKLIEDYLDRDSEMVRRIIEGDWRNKIGEASEKNESFKGRIDSLKKLFASIRGNQNTEVDERVDEDQANLEYKEFLGIENEREDREGKETREKRVMYSKMINAKSYKEEKELKKKEVKEDFGKVYGRKIKRGQSGANAKEKIQNLLDDQLLIKILGDEKEGAKRSTDLNPFLFRVKK